MNNYIDDRERIRQQVRDTCQQRGIAIVQVGEVYRLLGRGVDVTVTDLARLGPMDLMARPHGR